MSNVALTLYPSLINRACALLDERPDVRDLPEGHLRVMLRIVKKINLATPRSPIYAKRSTLAKESGKSVETVHRVIKWLESEGLIERKQKACAGLRGSTSPLVPTMKFLCELMLDPDSIARSYQESEDYITKKKQAKAEKNASKTGPTRETPNADAPLEAATEAPADAQVAAAEYPEEEAVETPQEPQATKLEAIALPLPSETTIETVPVATVQPVTQTSAQHQAERNHNRGFIKLENVKIPQELAWLVTQLSMRATGVLQLMGLAKKTGQRLSDVVQATGKYLEDLPGREAYAYIKALLKKGQDFAYKVREINSTNQEKADRAYLAEKAQALEGRSFINRDRSLIVTVESNGILILVRNGQRTAKAIGKEFLEAINAGRLVAYRGWV